MRVYFNRTNLLDTIVPHNAEPIVYFFFIAYMFPLSEYLNTLFLCIAYMVLIVSIHSFALLHFVNSAPLRSFV